MPDCSPDSIRWISWSHGMKVDSGSPYLGLFGSILVRSVRVRALQFEKDMISGAMAAVSVQDAEHIVNESLPVGQAAADVDSQSGSQLASQVREEVYKSMNHAFQQFQQIAEEQLNGEYLTYQEYIELGVKNGWIEDESDESQAAQESPLQAVQHEFMGAMIAEAENAMLAVTPVAKEDVACQTDDWTVPNYKKFVKSPGQRMVPPEEYVKVSPWSGYGWMETPDKKRKRENEVKQPLQQQQQQQQQHPVPASASSSVEEPAASDFGNMMFYEGMHETVGGWTGTVAAHRRR